MYQTLKKLIPSKFIKKHEPFLRSIIALVYRGSYCECNLCGYQLRKFVLLPTGDLLCPNCASMPRNRRLWQLIGTLAAGKKILHFSPPKSLQKKLRNLPSTTYITTDYAGEFNADKKFDITQIDEKDNTYDLIICYHVLEHIIDDISAMNELYRVLKPNGQCYIQTPFKTGKTYEDYSINTPEERLKHFDPRRLGQAEILPSASTDAMFTPARQ